MANNYLTQDDVNNYGRDLVDFSQRAALHSVTPALQNLQQQNEALRQQIAQESKYRLDQQLESAIPNFREIDSDPAWRQWLLGTDALSGRVRQALLNHAVASADAARVIYFFRQFLKENQAAGQPSAVRAGASAPSAKPVYTRAQIGQLYERRRKGQFTDDAWARIEADIFAAQREGRVQGVYLTK